MSLKNHFQMMADYNQSMNSQIYGAAGHLSAEELAEDRQAYFGSILGTLNHILVGDTIWLKRFATHPSSRTSLREISVLPNPDSLDQILFNDFAALTEHRVWLDSQIIHWIDTLTEADLDSVLSYRSTKGVPANKRFSSVILHFFNHQTHHRGQVSTLLSQAGRDVGVTDLLIRIPEEDHF
ncbi:damage-inducible protein DinB [Microbulbifer sp. SH-1]|uniref:DinB family protein n=1 Tax=Microbulbifer sp. SH-1 TaxID=2681547 RepID=UPI00140BDE17|nr:DinB family protein [Microbulbifer sp. SH-1]QIL91074.1 damage-inducible protein DinB [Microbulbifer sp. SH-1]